MLVLSRRNKESIVLPDCGVTITVLETSGNRVRIGIDAPAHVNIRRGELPPRCRGGTEAHESEPCVPC